jgi:hypothetical protein
MKIKELIEKATEALHGAIKGGRQFCIARWHLGLHGSSSSPEVWRPGKGKGILWNLTASPFGFRFQLWLRLRDDHRGLPVDLIK